MEARLVLSPGRARTCALRSTGNAWRCENRWVCSMRRHLAKSTFRATDAAEFLNRIYTNAWSKLEVGKCRYGLMLREDGMVFDDGVTTRIGPNHFI